MGATSVVPTPPAQCRKVIHEHPCWRGLAADIHFQFNSAELDKASRAKLDHFIKRFAIYDIRRIFIVGHSDSIGTRAQNLQMSRLRGIAVKEYFATRATVPLDSYYVEGRGATQPVADPKTADGRSINRRVEIEVDATCSARIMEEFDQMRKKQAACM